MLHSDSLAKNFSGSAPETRAHDAVKVVLIASSPREIGGQAIQAKGILENLAQDSSLDMGFIPTNPPLYGMLTPIEKIPYLRTFFTSLKFGYSLFRRVKEFDVVHVFSGGGTSYLISTLPPLFIAKLFKKKIVLNYHSGDLQEQWEGWKWLFLSTFKRFDSIVVPSQFLVDVFAKRGFASQAIPNFVDDRLFVFRERNEFSPRFLSTRNLEPHYNVACILRAFSLIQKEIPEASLVIAGDGSQKSRLKSLCAELNLKNVDFLGGVSRERTSELYRENDILLNSSNVDNMPLSIMEAFASGTVVVSTPAGGIANLITDGETGLLVSKDDDQALAIAALSLLRDKNLARRISENAHEFSLKHFSWNQIRTDWVKLYTRLGKDAR